MTKTPDFDERPYFGASSEGRPVSAPESIEITVGSIVDLFYRGKTTAILVTKVIEHQREFEGRIESFALHELEHKDLRAGDEVRFPYEKIAHIHSQGRHQP